MAAGANGSTSITKFDFFEWAERITMEIIGQSKACLSIIRCIPDFVVKAEFGVRFEAIEGARHPLMLCALV